MDGQQSPGINYNSIDGLTTVNATTISINGSTINLDSYIPYVGATVAPDFNGKQLKNIAIGTAGSDAAAFSQIPSITGLVPYTLAVSNVDLNGKQLKNIADGSAPQDAAAFNQIPSITGLVPYSLAAYNVDLNGKQLKNIADATALQDAITLSQFGAYRYDTIQNAAVDCYVNCGLSDLTLKAAAIGTINLLSRTTIQPTSNGTNIFRVKNAAGTSIFSVDTLTSAISCNTVLNVNSNKILNVADGTTTYDAVNYGQLSTISSLITPGLPAGTIQGSYIIHNGTDYINSAGGTVNLGIYSNNNLGFNTNIGAYAGGTVTGQYRVNVGNAAGATTQSDYCTAIGYTAGNSLQGDRATAVGNEAGKTSQGADSVAVGNGAAYSGQLSQAVAIGASAGETTQGTGAIAIGYRAQRDNVVGGYGSVSIGSLAGSHDVGINCVAVGGYAGYQGQSSNSVAIGYQAGYTNQHLSSIIINATGAQLNSASAAATYVAPVRTLTDGITSPQIFNKLAQYNTSSKELTCSGTTTFNVIIGSIATTDPSLVVPAAYFLPTGMPITIFGVAFTCTVVRNSRGNYTLTFPATSFPNFSQLENTITTGVNALITAPITGSKIVTAIITSANTIDINYVFAGISFTDLQLGESISLRIEFNT